MQKHLEIEPVGFPCILADCPPGFFIINDQLCFKTEYRTNIGKIEAYCESGEYFAGGADVYSEEERISLMVQPVIPIWRLREADSYYEDCK